MPTLVQIFDNLTKGKHAVLGLDALDSNDPPRAAARVSLYGKGTANGDTAVLTTSSGVVQVAVAGADGNADAQTSAFVVGPVATNRILCMAQFVLNGATWDRLRTAVKFIDIPSTAVTAGTGITAWTPAAGKKFRLMGWAVTLSVAGSVIFADNAVATIIYRTPALVAATPFASPPGLGNGFLSAAANNVLKIDVTATGNVSGLVFGTEE